MNKLIIISFLFFSCGNGRNLPEKGEKCFITGQCLAAKESYYDELNSVCNNKDEKRLEEMISSKYAFIIEPNYNLTMLEPGVITCKIKLVDIYGNKNDVMVATEFIK
jgi:hypothetical protein